MLRSILNRLLGMIVVMALVVTIVFVIVRVTPGDPAAVMLGPDATAADIAALRARLGLDGSILAAVSRSMSLAVVQGDLGQSIFLNQPVLTALAERAEPTLFLTLFSLLIATLIALPVGILAAYKRGSIFDQATTTVAMFARQHAELLARPAAHPALRRQARLVPTRRAMAGRAHPSSTG